LPDPQTSNLSPRVPERPRCHKCQSRMEIQHITSARSGFEHWTLRCTKCGLIHEAQVNADPMKSDKDDDMTELTRNDIDSHDWAARASEALAQANKLRPD
jgi:hypothetical protein